MVSSTPNCGIISTYLDRLGTETDEPIAVNMDFWSLFEQEVAALKERKDQKLAD